MSLSLEVRLDDFSRVYVCVLSTLCVCTTVAGQPGSQQRKECGCGKECRADQRCLPVSELDVPACDETEETREQQDSRDSFPRHIPAIQQPGPPAWSFDEPFSQLPGIVAPPQTQKHKVTGEWGQGRENTALLRMSCFDQRQHPKSTIEIFF